MGAAPFPAVIATKLAGNWRKDKTNSDVDCYARQLDLLQIQGIQKACALKLINGLQIESDQQCEYSLHIYLHQQLISSLRLLHRLFGVVNIGPLS